MSSSTPAFPSDIMAHDPLAGCRVIGFDLETTGFSPKDHRIVQFAMIGAEADGTPIDVERLVDPQRRIPVEASRVHGLWDADVKGAAVFKEHAAEIHAMMDGAVIVGHNVVRFDWPFLRAEFLRAGMLMPQPRAILDTLTLARRLKLPRSHALGALCERYGISLVNAHTAGADAAATLLLLQRMMAIDPAAFRRPVEEIPIWASGKAVAREAERLGPSLEDLEPLPGAGGYIRISGADLVLARGRHRGQTVRQVQEKDAAYIGWLLSNASPLEEEGQAALREHLA